MLVRSSVKVVFDGKVAHGMLKYITKGHTIRSKCNTSKGKHHQMAELNSVTMKKGSTYLFKLNLNIVYTAGEPSAVGKFGKDIQHKNKS